MRLHVRHLPIRYRRFPPSLQPALLSLLTVALMAGSACSRGGDTLTLTPPFNDRTKIGDVSAQWTPTGEERAFAEGRKLEAAEVQLQYRVDVRNRLQDKVFVRLADFRLMNRAGVSVGQATARIECVLSLGDSRGVLSGDIWVRKDAANDIAGFGLTHLAVPLSERGQGLYREWALQGRKGDATTVDAEIAAYAGAPACRNN